jgi:hypothetical protein
MSGRAINFPAARRLSKNKFHYFPNKNYNFRRLVKTVMTPKVVSTVPPPATAAQGDSCQRLNPARSNPNIITISMITSI